MSTSPQSPSTPTPELIRLQQLRDTVTWGHDDADFYGRAALEHGLRAQATEATWARWLIGAIDERASG